MSATRTSFWRDFAEHIRSVHGCRGCCCPCRSDLRPCCCKEFGPVVDDMPILGARAYFGLAGLVVL